MTTTIDKRDAIADALLSGNERHRFAYLNDVEFHAQVELLALHLPDEAAQEASRSTLAGIGTALAEAAERRICERLATLSNIIYGKPWHASMGGG